MFFFHGSSETKLDTKCRIVLPQQMRYGLIEEGECSFSLAMERSHCITIYRKSEMAKVVKGFHKRQYDARFHPFFTLFFSTLSSSSCDKLGRFVLPSPLRRAAGIESEVVIAGVMNKVEIWSKEHYQKELDSFLASGGEGLASIREEVFRLVCEEEEPKDIDFSDQGTDANHLDRRIQNNG